MPLRVNGVRIEYQGSTENHRKEKKNDWKERKHFLQRKFGIYNYYKEELLILFFKALGILIVYLQELLGIAVG